VKTFLLILSLFSLCLWSIINYKIRKYIYPSILYINLDLILWTFPVEILYTKLLFFLNFFFILIYLFLCYFCVPLASGKRLPSHQYIWKKMFSERKLLRGSSLRQSHKYPTRFPLPLFDRHSLPHQLMVWGETL
jgi:hypothetical protein